MEQQYANCASILILEDDDDIRAALQDFLAGEGYHVLAAANGQEGLELLERNSFRPCIILLDLFMPVMNGMEFLQNLRSRPDYRASASPVVIVSAAPPHDETVRAAKPLASGYINKPVDIDAVLKIVDHQCRDSSESELKAA